MKNTTITVIVVLLILASGGLFLFWKGKKTSKPAAGSPEQLAEARAAKAAKAKEKDVDSEDNNFRSVQAPDKMSPGANQTSRISEEKVLPGREEKVLPGREKKIPDK